MTKPNNEIRSTHRPEVPLKKNKSRIILTVYRITKNGGYHIAVALSPYHLGDTSVLAQKYDHRVEKNVTNPGYFKEVYETAFQNAGLFVEEYRKTTRI